MTWQNPRQDAEALTAGPIAAVSFKVAPRSIWAMKRGSLFLGEYAAHNLDRCVSCCVPGRTG